MAQTELTPATSPGSAAPGIPYIHPSPPALGARDPAHRVVPLRIPVPFAALVAALTAALAAGEPDIAAVALVTAFAHYLARISGDDERPLVLALLRAAGGRCDPPSPHALTVGWPRHASFEHCWRGVRAAMSASGPPSPKRELDVGVAIVEAPERDAPPRQYPTALWLLVGCADAPSAALWYDPDRVAATDAHRMAGHLETLLAEIGAAPSRPLGELEILTPGERLELLATWNATTADFPVDATVHALVAEQAERWPARPAVIAGDRRLTYAELRADALRWAAALRARGVGPDVVVAVRMPRTPEMVIAILAVLEAGGAYLPVDPSWPATRVAFVLRDTATPLLLTTSDLAADLPAEVVGDIAVLHLDQPLDAAGDEGAAVTSAAGPLHLAYVIYTSGSTGTPKGVLVEHRGAVNYLAWCIEAYALHEGSGAPVHSSLAFDLTVTSLLAPLAAGRTVVLVPDADGVDGLARALRAHPGFSLVKLTPAHLDVLRARLTPSEARGCTRRLVVGGEALHGESLAFWRRHAPDTIVVNEYGPTETVVGCCTHEVRAADAVPGMVPIGRPIANTQLHVLDAAGRLLPVGVPGELYIGGVGVARGYLNRPALTAERFVPDPFSARADARLYRTGDRVRRRDDGTLEFLGRTDDQVKLRGHRVELGEVEHVLRAHADVREAAVGVRAAPSGEPRLVAWIVPAGDVPTPTALADFVAARLPDYMVPAAWLTVAALPLTRNGKVDRGQLPDPEQAALALVDEAMAAPATPLERELLHLWRELLGKPVGTGADFFAAGGSSLLATQLVHRVGELLGRRLPFSLLLTAPTVRQLAAALARQDGDEELPVVCVRAGRAGVAPLFYFHGATSGGGFYMLEAIRHLPPDQPVYLVHPVMADGPATVEEMAELRLRQIREVHPHGPYHLGGTCNGASLAHAAACRLRDAGEEVGLLALVNAHDRTAGLRPLRRLVGAAARVWRLSTQREKELWLRARDRATWILPKLPHVGPEATLRDRLAFAAALAGHLARGVARTWRWGRAIADAAPPPPARERDDAGDDEARYMLVDVALRCWFPRRYDGRATLVFWERSFASDDLDGLHRTDATRGWIRHCAEIVIKRLPGTGHDLDTRDKAALGRELATLLLEEHARRGSPLAPDTRATSSAEAA